MPKKVAFRVLGPIVSVKNPRNEPSLHWSSGFWPTNSLDITSALAGEIFVPNEEGEVTAVPPNSTPKAPFPVTES